VIGLSSPKSTYDGIFLGNYADINLVDAIKAHPPAQGTPITKATRTVITEGGQFCSQS